VALASLDSLRSLFTEYVQVTTCRDQIAVQTDSEAKTNRFFVEGRITDPVSGMFDDQAVTDKNPTQDLELPEHIAAEIAERENCAQLEENNFDAFPDPEGTAGQDPVQVESILSQEIDHPADVDSSESCRGGEDELPGDVREGFVAPDLATEFQDQMNENDVGLNRSDDSKYHQNDGHILEDPYQTAAFTLPDDSMYPPEVRGDDSGDTLPETPGRYISDDEITLVDSQDENEPAENLANGDGFFPESVETKCPFCKNPNESNSVVCGSCAAILSLSDIESLIDNQHVDTLVLRLAVDEMESQRTRRDFEEAELINLGIGHLNLRNLQYGFERLQEASKLNPDNTALAECVNSLRSRIEETTNRRDDEDLAPIGKSILVVDDSPTVRKLIAEKLKSAGHTVTCSADGVEALESLEDIVPDLVLIDIDMPRMDGYQACRQIRSNPATKDVPVIMVSGKDGHFDEVRGKMAGTTGYITKPFGPETLMKTVEAYLSGDVPANAD
jgi:CheY-like chemotaxis protein